MALVRLQRCGAPGWFDLARALAEIVFALVPHCTNGDGLAIDDLEQRHVARGAKRDHKLAKKW